MTEDAGAPGTTPVATLKRIKETETEWAGRVAEARARVDTQLARLQAEAEGAVRAAERDAQAAREAQLALVRTAADIEARTIVEEGERAATNAAKGEEKDPDDRRDAILNVLLGGFRSG